MKWVDGWLRFYLGMVETCGMSRDMWLHERKGEKFIVQILFGKGVMCKWRDEKSFPSLSFLSQAESYVPFHLSKLGNPREKFLSKPSLILIQKISNPKRSSLFSLSLSLSLSLADRGGRRVGRPRAAGHGRRPAKGGRPWGRGDRPWAAAGRRSKVREFQSFPFSPLFSCKI